MIRTTVIKEIDNTGVAIWCQSILIKFDHFMELEAAGLIHWTKGYKPVLTIPREVK